MENHSTHPNAGKAYRNHERSERISIIHRMVHDATYKGKKVTAADLAKACGVDARTIYEDRLYMARHDMPMKFCRKNQTYKYTKAVDYNPKVLMNEGMFFTLMVAEKVLRECHSLEKRRLLLKIFKQIAAEYKDIVSFDVDSMDDYLTVDTMLQPKFDPARVEYLLTCCAKGIELELTYDTPKKGKTYNRKIRPYHLHKADRDWILFCYDFNRNDVIRLALGRMDDIEETGETFVRPADFNIDKELEGALIIYTGDDIEDVGLVFTPEVAHVIRENTVRCEKARRELPNGGLELTLSLGSFMDLPVLIGQYGGDAYPLYPPQAVQEYVGRAKAMLKAVGAE